MHSFYNVCVLGGGSITAVEIFAAICFPPCQNGGRCILPGTCACSLEYEGHRCQTLVNKWGPWFIQNCFWHVNNLLWEWISVCAIHRDICIQSPPAPILVLLLTTFLSLYIWTGKWELMISVMNFCIYILVYNAYENDVHHFDIVFCKFNTT